VATTAQETATGRQPRANSQQPTAKANSHE